MRKILRIFWKKYDGDLTQLSYAQYQSSLSNLTADQKKAAYEKAWDSRKFEIDLYWKRATYFWAIIVPTFAGYFAILNSDNYKLPDKFNHAELFIVICIGFILSVAWALVNRGSKTWQRHWEIHVDLLEDSITGPLYKTVHSRNTFSVSKINELISWFFAFIWVLLAYKFKLEQGLAMFFWNTTKVNLITSGMLLLSISIIFSFTLGYGRGYFSNRGFKMYKRNVTFVNPDKTKIKL